MKCLDKNTKIFICKGYGSLKRELLRRGWHENTNANSHIFNLKFVVRRDDIFKRKGIKYKELQDFQIVNHFSNNNVLTTKVGLVN